MIRLTPSRDRRIEDVVIEVGAPLLVAPDRIIYVFKNGEGSLVRMLDIPQPIAVSETPEAVAALIDEHSRKNPPVYVLPGRLG